MNTIKRYAAYGAGKSGFIDSSKLTPKQRKRIRQKANRDGKREQKVVSKLEVVSEKDIEKVDRSRVR